MQTNATYNEPSDSAIRVSPFINMSIRSLLVSIAVGALIGLVTAGISLLMNTYVFSSVLCRANVASSECASAPTYAAIVALIIGAVAGLTALAQTRMYRPLLVVIASTATLWSFHVLTASMPWYWALIVPVVLFGLVYGLFTWVARIRSFMMAVILTVVLVVAIRFLLVA